MENFLQDTRFALRQLRTSPGFAAKPLPYQSPARLVGVYEKTLHCERYPSPIPDYLDWKRLNTVFTSLDIRNFKGATIPRGRCR